MSSRRLLAARMAALASILCGGVYLVWRAGHLAGLDAPAYVLFAAEVVNYAAFIVAVLLFSNPGRRREPSSPPRGSVDVLIPVCGENVELVEATLRAALAIEYPHETVVLNDGRLAGSENWRDIVALCNEYRVRCLTRTSGTPGKAGNLNAALAQTSGEFVVVFDADHLARRDAAHMLLGYFEDPAIAFVASRQCFKLDPDDVLGHQESLFYLSIQPAKDRDNAAFSCGNGVAYRRAAIDEIGGFSEWNLVEDLHTSYELHARGWSSAYVPVPVSVGTAPGTAAEMANQRLRWATDSLRIFFWDNPLRKRGLSWRQRLHYLHTTGWYIAAAAPVIFILSPIVSIVFGARLIAPGTEVTYGLLVALYLGAVAATLAAHVGWRVALRTAQTHTFLAPAFALALPRALVDSPGRRARGGGGEVTRKSGQRRLSWITVVQHAVLAALLVSVGVAVARPDGGSWVVIVWACILAAALASPSSMLGQPREASQALRIAIAAPALVAAALVAMTVGPTSALDARTAAQVASTAPAAAPSGAGAGEARTRAPAGPPLAPPRTGIYLGVFNTAAAGPPSRPLTLSRYRGIDLRIVHRFQAWWGPDRFLGRRWLASVARRGAAPMVSWEPWRKPKDMGSAPTQRPRLLQRIASGRFDGYVRRWARDARAYGKPLLIRFLHEMNGTWYPWSVDINGNTAADFRAAWRRVHDIFRRAGATNVSWVFSVDSYAGGPPTSRANLQRYYPGADYVDWVGLSGFNWSRTSNGGVLSYERVFRPSYDVLAGFDKPIMLAEIGTAADDTVTAPGWIGDVMRSTPTRFPRVKAIVWYDATHPQRDFTLRGEALRALHADAARAVMRPALRLRAVR